MPHPAVQFSGGRAARRALGAVLGAVVLAGASAGAASAQLPTTDVRSTLAPGATDAQAGKAALGLEHLANRPKPEGVAGTNSDLAFQGDYAFNGNYDGFHVYNIADPADPKLVASVLCPGSQNDVSVWGNLLFLSVESTSARKDCARQPTGTPLPAGEGFRGIRIFDISNPASPQQVAGVQTCRGSHTHTLVRPKGDPANVYIYVSGTSTTPNAHITGCNNGAANTENPMRWRIEVIKVPVANPTQAAIVNESRLFADATGKIDGLQNAPQTPQHPSGINWSPSPVTDACHDITVYEELDLAAGACEGNGLLIDISDPANPKRIDAVADPLFAYWHGATFSNDGKAIVFTDEWGGGSAARCRATDQLSWGANAIYEIVDNKLVFRSYYKLPVAQTNQENCVSHVGNLIPVEGRNILVQAWYQGGVSVMDFTNLAQPKEIAYFDRGPVSSASLVSGGFWSTYWYNGRIYGSEIARGFDSFKLAATENLTAAEIGQAEQFKSARLNAQSQDRFVATDTPGDVGGNVPATLSLSIAAPASFGAFTPGIAKLYEASSDATVTSTAGDALLSVSDGGPNPGHLVNGAFSLAQPLQIRARNAANTGTPYNNVGSSLNLLQYGAPISNDAVSLQFAQQVNANDPLRTGTYSKTLTFTLSTTNP